MEKIGYRTQAQEKILEYLRNDPGKHHTAMDIKSYFDCQGIRIGTATIYRQLDRFVEEGRIRKYILGPGECACYAYMDPSESCISHFHCKCTQCGRLIHLNCEELKEIQTHLQEHHGFMWDAVRTVFYGICGECQLK